MPASLKPIEIYALMHDPMLCIEYMLDMKESGFDKTQVERLKLQWWNIFYMDSSGRSTGKSHNLLAGEVVKLPLIPARTGILLGLDKKIGNELFDEHVVNWLRGSGHLKDYHDVRRSDMEGRIAKKEYGASAEFKCAHKFRGMPQTNSLVKTMTPDHGKGGVSLQSWRFNFLHFSEWTSYSKPEIMAETIEPIVTRTNWMYKITQDLMIYSETHLQRVLGRIDNEAFSRAFGLVEGRHPRPHLGSVEKVSIDDAIMRFKRNFFVTYGFHYDEGIGYENINFQKLNTEEDLVRFFTLFDRGDAVYANQITYDGSAKRPSDECYLFKKFFSDQVDSGHPNYSYFSCSVEDIDPKFDGIIFDSAIIKKYKESNLDEDYQRVYGGVWTEGYKNKPYDPASITRSMRDYYPMPIREDGYEYIIAVDAAKGTERMRSSGKKKSEGTGHGDDAGAAIIRVGDGTANKPHRVTHVYIAEDVRKDPMAVDLHMLVDIFQPIMVCLDPGGGGGDLADSLAKEKLFDTGGRLHTFQPLVPHDYELDDDGVIRILHFISRANDFIRAVYIRSDSDKSTWRGDDALTNKIHETVSTMFDIGAVEVPVSRSSFELAQLSNKGLISGDELEHIEAAQKAVAQINAIRYAMDPRTGTRKKTVNGLFQFQSPRRKDLAYCVIYGLFMANVYLKIEEIINIEDDIPISRG